MHFTTSSPAGLSSSQSSYSPSNREAMDPIAGKSCNCEFHPSVFLPLDVKFKKIIVAVPSVVMELLV